MTDKNAVKKEAGGVERLLGIYETLNAEGRAELIGFAEGLRAAQDYIEKTYAQKS
ncbi:MAG: hypothetical protein LBH93_01545 [Chitinispirillales bacterium]|jgi:hypothetical protein|nr:hypothetical protein [Chitinispirillales bacterium]